VTFRMPVAGVRSAVKDGISFEAISSGLLHIPKLRESNHISQVIIQTLNAHGVSGIRVDFTPARYNTLYSGNVSRLSQSISESHWPLITPPRSLRIVTLGSGNFRHMIRTTVSGKFRISIQSTTVSRSVSFDKAVE